MIELDEFLLKSSIVLLVFFAGYRFLLKKGTYFKHNRIYLLAGLMFSLFLPFLSFQLPGNNVAELFVTLDSINISANGTLIEPENEFVLLNYLQFIYLSVVFILFSKVLFQVYLLLKMFVQSKTEIIGETKLVITNKKNAVFSFFHFVFANNESLKSADFQTILKHEQVHITQKHSVDILLAELLTIVLWFNPFAWLYKKSIKENHEFLADEGVISNGYSANHYQKVLFEQSTGLHLSLANNFNQSLTFKRLNMMKKIRSNNLAKYKVLLMIPAFLLMIFFVACSEEEKTEIESHNPDEMTELIDNQESKSTVADRTDEKYSEDKAYKVVENWPEYPGGGLELRKFITKNIKYPEEARESGISGKVYVRFIVTNEGDVANVSVIRSADPLLDNEAIRVVKLLSGWIPGEQKGEKVDVWLTLPINFQVK